ncbi:hypothetical protein AB0F77_28370 [Streptomyces sp. NPDC026672]|uniref:hypothetical protein n=1 Tax=unclassified Streptomyces TaxID=2593676 RepID=UPI003406D184
MLSDVVDKAKSVEDLEGVGWPEPPGASTSLVRGVHTLRKRPVEARPGGGPTGWYDDLLSAVLTRKEPVWRSAPDWARHLNETVAMLTDVSPYLQREVDTFQAALTDLL